MASVAAVFGAFSGLGIQLYSNGVRKLRLMHHPWEHLLAMGIGAYVGDYVVKWEEKASKELEKTIEETKTSNRRRFGGLPRE